MRGRKIDTLCWDCKKAVKGCAWSRRFEPVPGWKAERVRRDDLADGETYCIIECPEFEPDRKPEIEQRKDAYTERDFAIIREGVRNGESTAMIAWRLGRGVYGVRDRIRMMRRAGEI